MAPEVCPNCGAEVPRDAKACPECGADEETGWSDEARSSDLDLPDENFDYGEFIKREFGKKKSFVPHGIHMFWWIVAVVVFAICLWMWLR